MNDAFLSNFVDGATCFLYCSTGVIRTTFDGSVCSLDMSTHAGLGVLVSGISFQRLTMPLLCLFMSRHGVFTFDILPEPFLVRGSRF